MDQYSGKRDGGNRTELRENGWAFIPALPSVSGYRPTKEGHALG